MKVDRINTRAVFRGEDGDELAIHYDNRGEPYREGVSLMLDEPRMGRMSSVFLTCSEALEMADLIYKLFPPRK